MNAKISGQKRQVREGSSKSKGVGEITKRIFLPAIMPETTVATMGVCVLLWTRARTRNRRPSSAIAYITRGMGNMEPKRLERRSPQRHELTELSLPKPVM
jgi:hypothetical protein